MKRILLGFTVGAVVAVVWNTKSWLRAFRAGKYLVNLYSEGWNGDQDLANTVQMWIDHDYKTAIQYLSERRKLNEDF